ncbi:MAG TPA: alpha/beta hydrolase [Phnomibacter sp.]|nr:alpha/beta hydrolase [Phnomibacter sp.]
MKKVFRIALNVLAVLTIVYILGPAPSTPIYNTQLPAPPADVVGLEQYVQQHEAIHKLRPNNEARIVWANDSTKAPTEYVIVYLHGFSASQEEGNPTHRNIAKKMGANLYLARLAEHGVDTVDQLINYTAENLWTSAQEAFAIGRQLGKKVILMGTSTGGSVALQLAAAYPEIAGLILISPNIRINDANAWLLNNHWGKQIVRLVVGSDYRHAGDYRPIYAQYWNAEYRIESLVQLQEYLETAMVPKTFEQVKQPVLVLAYYKNEQEQDKVVQVSAMRNMYAELGTVANQKQYVELSTTGDHVQGSPIKSKDVGAVEKEIEKFLKEVMSINMHPETSSSL